MNFSNRSQSMAERERLGYGGQYLSEIEVLKTGVNDASGDVTVSRKEKNKVR